MERLELGAEEIAEWAACAESMSIPYDEVTGINPQDAHFLDREIWDLKNTPAEKRPLLLHYHPLVIYRFQVLKQADVVLALFLQGDHFTKEQKRNNFEYYDPITTGDSTLSGIVQSIIAAEVGYRELALRYFYNALFVDLADLHGNTSDGVHVASTGGVWNILAYGFGGMRDYNGIVTFDPGCPSRGTADVPDHAPRHVSRWMSRAARLPSQSSQARAPSWLFVASASPYRLACRAGFIGRPGLPHRGPAPVQDSRSTSRWDADHCLRAAGRHIGSINPEPAICKLSVCICLQLQAQWWHGAYSEPQD